MSGFEIGVFIVTAFIFGVLFSREYAIDRFSLAWQYLIGTVTAPFEKSRELKRKIESLTQTVEYRDRRIEEFKRTLNTLLEQDKKTWQHQQNAESMRAAYADRVQSLAHELQESRAELADQYKDWANLKVEKVRIEETLAEYAKLLTEERMEGFQLAHQVGTLKNENIFLKANLQAAEVNAKKAKKSSRKFPQLHKR
jgi:chromosome segregation ATPase